MRILITTDAFMPVVNGVVTSTLNLYKQLKAHGHEVKILTLAHGGHSRKEGDFYYIRSFGVRIYPNARATINYLDHYVQEIVDWQPEIVHSQTEFCTFLFAIKIARKLDIPVIHTYHTLYQDYTSYFTKHEILGQKLVIAFSRKLLKHVDEVIVPTEKTKKILQDYGVRDEIEVIPNGIELELFKKQITKEEKTKLKQSLGIPLNHKVIVTVGRLGIEKNVDEILDSMKTLLKVRQDITLLIVGDGPHKLELEQRTKQLGIESNVIFTGMIDSKQVYKYYKLGDIFVSASTSETQGLTYIEALANELPIICRKDECLDGVLKNGYNGYNYEEPEALVELINMLFDDEQLYNSIKANTGKSVECFSSEIFGERVAKLYAKVVNHSEEIAEKSNASLIG